MYLEGFLTLHVLHTRGHFSPYSTNHHRPLSPPTLQDSAQRIVWIMRALEFLENCFFNFLKQLKVTWLFLYSWWSPQLCDFEECCLFNNGRQKSHPHLNHTICFFYYKFVPKNESASGVCFIIFEINMIKQVDQEACLSNGHNKSHLMKLIKKILKSVAFNKQAQLSTLPFWKPRN